MPIMFNSLLQQAGIDPRDVHLVRHQDQRADRERTPYRLWSQNLDAFLEYQSRQAPRTAKEIGSSKYWAAFVVSPPRNETLFVGLYAVLSQRSVPGGVVKSVTVGGTMEGEHVNFDLEPCDELSEFGGKVVIDWGLGFIKWTQQARANDKIVLEVRRQAAEEKFVGYLAFKASLSEIANLPNAWIDRLREAKGVYLLSCPNTGENYVGSATGEGGFYSRWIQHSMKGGDAVRFKTREPSDLQVCILEVAGSGMTERGILHAEYRWIDKLKPALNGHSTLLETPRVR